MSIVKQIFCFHKYRPFSQGLYQILNKNKEAIGTVTISVSQCYKCEKEKVNYIDRKMFKQ